MAAFWSDWALWIKLIFLLACGIGLTVIAAIVKAVGVQKRKHEQQPSKNDCFEQTTEPDNPPFGAAALEQGIQVEGIWTSPATSIETLSEVSLIAQTQPAASTTHIAEPGVVQPATHRPEAHISTVLTGTQPPGHFSLFMLRNPDFARAIDDIEAEYQASKSEEERVAMDKQAGLPRASSDLSMLDRRRQIHAAETGQLRRKRSSLPWVRHQPAQSQSLP